MRETGAPTRFEFRVSAQNAPFGTTPRNPGLIELHLQLHPVENQIERDLKVGPIRMLVF